MRAVVKRSGAHEASDSRVAAVRFTGFEKHQKTQSPKHSPQTKVSPIFLSGIFRLKISPTDKCRTEKVKEICLLSDQELK
jgi:hypothetical protein